MKYLLLILLLPLAILSCKESPKEKIAKLVTAWQGKEIIFPSDMVFTQLITDTVNYTVPDADYKVLIYVDSLGCTSCKLQLPKWKELITQVDSLTDGTVPFLFYFHPKDLKEIKYIFRRDHFDLPVCIDKEDRLNKQNQFPADITFQTFLLDKNNKVVVIGNPVHNLAVKELYIKQLSEDVKATKKPIITTANVDPQEINLGKAAVGETKKADFIVNNIGNSPLVILDSSTTCGCTVVTFDKHPAQPGQTLHVTVEMTPKESGLFDETIMIKCNTEKPIQLKIRGQAQ